MILDGITHMGAWGWIALAAVLVIAEMLAGGYFLLWLGSAAVATGLIFLAWPAAGWQAQISVFAVLSLASVAAWFSFARNTKPTSSDQPDLNERLSSLVGREFLLEEPIQAGRGRVRIADSVWSVAGPDCASGTRVTVRAVDGATLVVTPA
ncbi:NfeD family protein [Phreatobacter aquaticus]|uniref:NfeD family protein n=1 Tax=Phreatobacter aquaticus TaxID=2570229 RepID=A0A4D7QL24_9HYPH|nr:NfeD family protein [Phreatobacter aquaticus]QCK84992.1 NfeD family protein [Phreatobacter aquaticus]